MFFNYMIAHIISKLLTKWPNNATSSQCKVPRVCSKSMHQVRPELGDVVLHTAKSQVNVTNTVRQKLNNHIDCLNTLVYFSSAPGTHWFSHIRTYT